MAEDSPTQSGEIRLLLEEEGFEVEEVRSAPAALNKIRVWMPDVVVTDMVMAGMDGIALVEAVRHDFPYLPTVVVTAYGSEEAVVRALAAGAASYVPKRNLWIDLVPTLRNILELSLGLADGRQALQSLENLQARFVIKADPSFVTTIVRHIESVLNLTGFGDPTDVLRVGVALHEALVEAVKVTPEGVRLTFALTGMVMTFTVEGKGVGRTIAALYGLNQPSLPLTSEARRRCLLWNSMDEVVQDEDSVTLRKRHQAGTAPPEKACT